MNIKCFTEFLYIELQLEEGRKKIERMKCKSCPIYEKCERREKDDR